MDASTFVVARLNEQRARELDRDLAHLAAHAERRDALGGAEARPAARVWVARLFRRSRPVVPACDPGCLALAGPAS